jgi:hypothetical protein
MTGASRARRPSAAYVGSRWCAIAACASAHYDHVKTGHRARRKDGDRTGAVRAADAVRAEFARGDEGTPRAYTASGPASGDGSRFSKEGWGDRDGGLWQRFKGKWM